MNYTIYTDGGARGNPGPAGSGAVIYSNDGKVLKRIALYIGETTNNQAEYKAVVAALEYMVTLLSDKIANPTIQMYLDSKLIVEQMNGRFKIKNEGLKPLYWQIRDLIMKLGGAVTFSFVPREKNTEADELVNLALDEEVKKQ